MSEMFRFARPEMLYALALVPLALVLLLLALRRKKKALKRFGDLSVISPLMGDVSRPRPVLKGIVLLLALTALIVALAQPQSGSKLEEVKREGVEIIIALDVSNSMLAQDIRPNRLMSAKFAILQLIEKLRNDKIGLIVFAGDAYVQVPITTDLSATKMFLESVSPEIVPKQGTAIGSAIDLASKSFGPAKEGKEQNRVVLIITDGENHEGNALTAAEAAAEKGIVIHTLGMGSASGEPIPVRSASGHQEYRKDNDGNVVVSKLNETMLQQIASTANGIYVRANNSQAALDMVLDEIAKMEKSEMEVTRYSDYEDRFQYFLAVALFLLLIDFLILDKKNPLLKNLRFFDIKT